MSRPISNALSRSQECTYLAPRLMRLGGARDALPIASSGLLPGIAGAARGV